MSSVPDANLYAPPAAHVEDIMPDADVSTLGGRGARLGAALIDGVIGAAVGWGLWKLTPIFALVSTGAWSIASVPLVGALFALVNYLLIFRESRQCLHDNIADTIVVVA